MMLLLPEFIPMPLLEKTNLSKPGLLLCCYLALGPTAPGQSHPDASPPATKPGHTGDQAIMSPSAEPITPTKLAARANAILHEIMDHDRTWVGIHAAEALAACGEASFVHERFRQAAAAEKPPFPRIGTWRVLATTAPTIQQRTIWIGHIEQVFLDPQAPDRKQAIESLAKLGHRVTGTVLLAAKQMAAEPPEMNTILPVWCLHNSGEPEMTGRLQQALGSNDPVARQRAAYALRWIRPTDPVLLAALARAAAREPAGTLPRTFLLSAAVVLQADPARQPGWKAELEATLHTGPVAASFEAGQALATCSRVDDLPGLARLLEHPERDTRVAAATVILQHGHGSVK